MAKRLYATIEVDDAGQVFVRCRVCQWRLMAEDLVAAAALAMAHDREQHWR